MKHRHLKKTTVGAHKLHIIDERLEGGEWWAYVELDGAAILDHHDGDPLDARNYAREIERHL